MEDEQMPDVPLGLLDIVGTKLLNPVVNKVTPLVKRIKNIPTYISDSISVKKRTFIYAHGMHQPEYKCTKDINLVVVDSTPYMNIPIGVKNCSNLDIIVKRINIKVEFDNSPMGSNHNDFDGLVRKLSAKKFDCAVPLTAPLICNSSSSFATVDVTIEFKHKFGSCTYDKTLKYALLNNSKAQLKKYMKESGLL